MPLYSSTARAFSPMGRRLSRLSAVGGNSTITYTIGNVTYRAHIFTASGSSSLNVSGSGLVDYLVIGGGGAGGNGADAANNGGGGGGGGFQTGSLILSSGSYNVFVGNGGGQNTMANGQDSVFHTITALGGGGGGGRISGGSNRVGNNGASGGGGGPAAPNGGGSGTSGQGFAGAAGNTASPFQGGGGGGASEAGNTNGTGFGGDGLPSAIVGSVNYYSGGGGGGADANPGGGGLGGGAAGTIFSSSHPSPATPNTGGGGGGGASRTFSMFGSQGGSGIVVVRYPILNRFPITTSGLVFYVDSKVSSSTPGSGNTWFDMSGFGLNATGSSAVSTSTGLAWNQPYSTASTKVLDNNRHTIGMWLQINGTTGTWDKIFGYEPSGTDRSPGIWRFPSNRWIHWMYDPGNVGINITPTATFPGTTGPSGAEFDINTWYYIVVVKNDSTLTAYVNGVSVGSQSGAFPKTTGDAAIRLFPGYTGSTAFMGACQIYNRTLSASEILSNFNAQRALYGV